MSDFNNCLRSKFGISSISEASAFLKRILFMAIKKLWKMNEKDSSAALVVFNLHYSRYFLDFGVVNGVRSWTRRLQRDVLLSNWWEWFLLKVINWENLWCFADWNIFAQQTEKVNGENNLRLSREFVWCVDRNDGCFLPSKREVRKMKRSVKYLAYMHEGWFGELFEDHVRNFGGFTILCSIYFERYQVSRDTHWLS